MSISKDIFHQNEHPYGIFNNCENKFINNKLNPKAEKRNSKNENNRCETLPYVGNVSQVLKKTPVTQLKPVNYHCNVGFKTFKLTIFFSLKDMIN